MITPIRHELLSNAKHGFSNILYKSVNDRHQDCMNYYHSTYISFHLMRNEILSAFMVMFLEYVKEHKV